MKLRVLIALLILFANSSNLEAFEVSTHRILNRQAAFSVSPNGFSLDSYLKSNLGFANGILYKFIDPINGESALDYISDGGAHEDDGHWYQLGSRYLNHFHNPLKPWDQAGFNNYLIFTGESSLLWAQRPILTQNTFGNYSWNDARNYYYNALTNENPTNREYSFADTFRAVGQVMHLIQDASVPAHTRNDPHIFYNYEKWVKNNQASPPITNLINHPIFSTVPLSVSIDGYNPISQFWDTNQYDGSFPLTGTDIGIAEYSNANFLSEDTIFSGDFPYPNKSLTELWIDQSNNRKYLRSIGRGEPVQHQTAVSALYWYRLSYFPQYSQFWPLGLDDKSYKEEASYLVPRAVGYSAGLLNYFFRGKLSIETVDPNHVIVRNLSDDPLNDGTIELFCDDTDGKRVRVGGPISVSSIPKDGETSAITITPPPNIRKGYWAVFRGTLGAEQNAVIGSFTDLVWVEEWDKGFIGNHPWWVKMTDPIYQNYTVPGGSLQPTTVQDGDLTMSNFRPAGTVKTGPDSGVQNNQLIIGVFSSDSKFAPYNDSFPKTISPNTFIRIKVDAMSTAPSPYQPSGFCDPALSSIGDPPWWEYIDLNFSVDGREYNIKFTTPGNEGYDWSYYGYYNVYLTLGSEKRINVYQLFQSLGIPIPIGKTLQLNFIDIEQQLWDYCSPLSVDQQQSLQMDYLRILEETTPQSP